MLPPTSATGRGDAARTGPGAPVFTTIGDWQLVRQIDERPLSLVYQARPLDCPPHWPSDYAVKILREQHEDDPMAVDVIRREAYVGRRVSHPHLVSILSAGVAEPPYHVVMPYLAGVSLLRILEQRQRLSTCNALWTARQLAQALTALHREGWLHGDVKPTNVLVSPAGHATLLDLGFARPVSLPGSVVDRPIAGTYAYAAPELFTSAYRADQRSDIYSLGATLYELLTGRPPFGASDPAQMAVAHLEHQPDDPRSLVPHLGSDVAGLLKRMLAKEPLRRPQTADELVNRLVQLEIDALAEEAA